MKLSDIKKLKVAELRSRLTQAGLDSRGLKVELVERLWSFLDNNGGQRGNIDEQDVQRQGNSLLFNCYTGVYKVQSCADRS